MAQRSVYKASFFIGSDTFLDAPEVGIIEDKDRTVHPVTQLRLEKDQCRQLPFRRIRPLGSGRASESAKTFLK